ncbi:MAG: glutathione S-transferase family protein [Polyangiaceae bacterium]
MSIVLYHHPYSRAAGVVWSLEEVGVPYELRFVDIMKGEQKGPEIVSKNPMGKLPTLTDGDLVVTEAAAIALYLGDRYAYGTLAPKVDDPRRGTYLRWAFFSPSVIEPGASAKLNNWAAKPTQVGWGTFEAMLATIESAIKDRPYILGDEFSMADVVLGGTLGYMLRFGMIDKTPVFTEYVDRLSERPASKRAEAKNEAIRKEHGLG